MNALTMLMTALGISIASALAQAPPGPTQPPAPTVESAATVSDPHGDLLRELADLPLEKVEQFISKPGLPRRTLPGTRIEATGVLPELRRTARPWQLINPLAPARYGTGEALPGFRPESGRGPGFVVLALRF